MVGKYPRTSAVRESRRKRAEEVQAKSAGLSAKERLANLDKLGLVATKERLKLANRIKREAETQTKKK